jgi:hypothetical protein
MSTFADALRKGLKADDEREEARRQLEEVLGKAATELSSVLGVQLTLTVERVTRYTPREPGDFAVVFTSPRYVTALVARGKHAQTELADVDLPDLVFPITVRWDDKSALALDVEGFSGALMNVLESPMTGEKMKTLVRNETSLAAEKKEAAKSPK